MEAFQLVLFRELEEIVKIFFPKKQKMSSESSYEFKQHSYSQRGIEYSDYLIYNVAILFKDKVHIFWEKAINAEKLSTSNYSHSGDSKYSISELDKNTEDTLFGRVERTAFNVPFPIVSAGKLY
jgi:hypothetical protein